MTISDVAEAKPSASGTALKEEDTIQPLDAETESKDEPLESEPTATSETPAAEIQPVGVKIPDVSAPQPDVPDTSRQESDTEAQPIAVQLQQPTPTISRQQETVAPQRVAAEAQATSVAFEVAATQPVSVELPDAGDAQPAAPDTALQEEDTIQPPDAEPEATEEPLESEPMATSEPPSAEIQPVGVQIPDVPATEPAAPDTARQESDSKAQPTTVQLQQPTPTISRQQETVRQHWVAPASQPQRVSLEPASMKISSVAEPKPSVPDTSPARKSDTESHKVKEQIQQKVHSKTSEGNLVKTSSAEVKGKAHIIDAMRTSEALQKPEIVKKEKLYVTPSSSKREKPVTDDVETVKENIGTTIKGDFSLQRGVSRLIGSEEKSETESHQAPKVSSPQGVGADIFNRSNRDAARRIEQLRHTVQDLASKVSSLQSRINDETKRQQLRSESPQVERSEIPQSGGESEKALTPTAQPVVIIKRSPNQTKTPRAFWERSYLGRFHSKLLR